MADAEERRLPPQPRNLAGFLPAGRHPASLRVIDDELGEMERRGRQSQRLRWRDLDARDPESDLEFCEIETVEVGPEDDLGAMIRLHAKVALRPGTEYVLPSGFSISTCCYVIGRSATIILPTGVGPISVMPLSPGPLVQGLYGVTFLDVRFEQRDHSQDESSILFHCDTAARFVGCSFMGFSGVCLKLQMGGELFGCYFSANYKCIESHGAGEVVLRSCTFNKNMLGVIGYGPVEIRFCTFLETHAAVVAHSGLVFDANSVVFPNTVTDASDFSMLCCANMVPVPLCTVHVVHDPNKKPAEVRRSNFVCCRMHLGNRCGSYTVSGNTFTRCSVLCTPTAVRKVDLTPNILVESCVYKLLRREGRQGPLRKCVCGKSHASCVINVHDLTETAVSNPFENSVLVADPYVTSEDEE
ncbi:E1B 55K [Mastadenovirus porcusquartum]|uniref:E1B 55 kDa protein n=1 Tax=Mastadenovirus porcusquartum TaxID=3241439 RepID=A0A5P9VI51_9ADEN|nr:E1B 55K [Porcine mastadenovirus B]QFX65708.1 E1B 55K [Porcine mastadenovirus B]